MISDLNGLLGARYFLNVTNERTCFASCMCALTCTLCKKLYIGETGRRLILSRHSGSPWLPYAAT